MIKLESGTDVEQLEEVADSLMVEEDDDGESYQLFQ